MMHGKIKSFTVVTVEEDIKTLEQDEKSLVPFIVRKHNLAEKHNRYVVRFEIEDPRFTDCTVVNVFLPKGIIDNNLIDTETYIECGSDSCHLKIVGVEDWFTRASNGMTQIHDKRYKDEVRGAK